MSSSDHEVTRTRTVEGWCYPPIFNDCDGPHTETYTETETDWNQFVLGSVAVLAGSGLAVGGIIGVSVYSAHHPSATGVPTSDRTFAVAWSARF